MCELPSINFVRVWSSPRRREKFKKIIRTTFESLSILYNFFSRKQVNYFCSLISDLNNLKQKKRKAGCPYSGMSVSQLIAQREKLHITQQQQQILQQQPPQQQPTSISQPVGF